ncbi:unnamed protein product, partial [marine sediment metagenome]
MKKRDELDLVAYVLGLDTTACRTKDDVMDLLAAKLWDGKRPLLPQLPVMLARNVKDLKGEEFEKLLH